MNTPFLLANDALFVVPRKLAAICMTGRIVSSNMPMGPAVMTQIWDGGWNMRSNNTI
jgi:hypothetical protein